MKWGVMMTKKARKGVDAMAKAADLLVADDLRKKKYTKVMLKENALLWMMALPSLVLIFVFSYMPMYGVIVAFQKYMPGKDIIGPNAANWVGLTNFRKFVSGYYFWRVIKNSLIIDSLEMTFCFFAPIAFALLLDQVRNQRFKKTLQTVSYMPHFISTVVVAGMVLSFVYRDGLITNILALFGMPAKDYRMETSAFRTIYTSTKVWKGFGWSSILYTATISGIDPNLYEAARLDGANRWQQAWHITLVGLRHIVAINLIMSIGDLLAADSGLILLLYTPATFEVADVVGTYIHRLGIEDGQYALTSAAGLFMSAIGFMLTFTANKISDWLTGYSLW